MFSLLTGLGLLQEWVWTEEWVKCSRELNRWEELHQFGLENNLALAADCAWHLPQTEWQNLKKLIHTRKDQFPDMLRYLMLNIYSALHDGDISTASGHIKHAMQQCLMQWWQLPEVGVAPQAQLLQTFQSLVELFESMKCDKQMGVIRLQLPLWYLSFKQRIIILWCLGHSMN